MKDNAANIKTVFQDYADRGVFSNFSVLESNSKKPTQFVFNWLAETPFQIKHHSGRNELEIHRILPRVSYRSPMDKAFREFLQQRCADSVPEHRRLDDKKYRFSCRNRGGDLSVTLGYDRGDECDAAATSIRLLHEIFNNFLMEGPYQNYMVEVFNLPEE